MEYAEFCLQFPTIMLVRMIADGCNTNTGSSRSADWWQQSVCVCVCACACVCVRVKNFAVGAGIVLFCC